MLVKNIIRQILNNKYEREQKIYCVAVCIAIWIAIIYVIIISSPITHANERNERISLDLSNVEKFRLETDAELTRRRNENCSYWDCFNIYRCGERLSIYIYPLVDYYDAEKSEAKSSLAVLSKEFFEILKIIIESPYYTSDPKEACILVPSIDTLNLKHIDPSTVSKALATLPYWENGENHLLFNIVPPESGIESFNTDRAIVAGANFDSWTYRTGFDVAFPFLGYVRDEKMVSLSKARNSFWLTVSTLNLNEVQLSTMTDVVTKSDRKILLLDKCPKNVPNRGSIGVRCAYGTSTTYDIKSVYAQSQFCLIAKTERLFELNFIEALAANCIPVIFADNVILPFSEIIDWQLAVVTLREADLQSINLKLRSISLDKIDELQRQGEWLYEQYLASNEKIVKTMLAELNDRIFAYRAKSYFDWNMPAQRVVQNPLFLSRVAHKSQGFTAVILTYDRIESLFQLIQKLSVVMSLQKILVVWNNEKEAPPHISIFPKISKPLKVIRTKANKLSNRFYPYEEIETEAILTIDDDIIMLTADELDFGYEVWREFPDRIVGFPSRTHIWDNHTLRWRYESEWTNQISMVLTGAAFHHKYWSYAYTNQMPAEIKEWVDDHMNCEDIAMNFLVANFTKKPPIKVAPRKKFKCPECTNTEMLSADINHMMERSACIDRFAKVYGTMTLRTVEFRADPVLYKDIFPEKLKRFNDVGSL